MPFDADVEIRSDIGDALRREWSFLANSGTWFSGEERVAIAAEARAAMESLPADRRSDQAVAGERAASRPASILGEHVRDVVRMVAASSPLISAEWVAGLEGRGVELPAYAEIIGVVARLSSVDFFHIALGLPLLALPQPRPGEPTRVPPSTDLIVGKSFVPMVAPVSIPHTISLVPPETIAWQELTDVMYMSFEEMGDPDFRRSLHRTQIELVAARTSQVNECFY